MFLNLQNEYCGKLHLKIDENSDLKRDEFRFLRGRKDTDVTNEMDLDKQNTVS